MMIRIICRDTGKELAINSDYITEVDEIVDSVDHTTYSRVYLGAGHRTFIDAQINMDSLISMINQSSIQLGKQKALITISESLKEIKNILKKG